MMTPLLCLAALAPTVETADAAAKRLAAALGQKVQLESALRKQPVLIDAEGLGEAQILKALAFALHASLLRDEKGLRIERTAADRKAVHAAHVAANRTRLAKGLATWDRILKRADAMGDPAVQVRRARAGIAEVLRRSQEALDAHGTYTAPSDLMGEYMVTPAGRLLRGLLDRVGLDRLAETGATEVRYLANRPNAAESPLPACDDLLAAYARLQATYSATMGLPSAGPPAKAILRLDPYGASVDLYDARGKRTDTGFVNYEMRPVVAPAFEPDPGAVPNPQWIALDEPSRRMAALFDRASGTLSVKTLPEAYLHPEREDPLNFAVRAATLALPREKKPLVAALSDGLLRHATVSVKGDRLNVSGFERRAFAPSDGVLETFERAPQAGATVVRPLDPESSEPGLVDREALGREIRRIVADRSINFRNWCALHLALYSDAAQPVGDVYVGALGRLGFPAFRFYNNQPRAKLALIGAALKAGATVSPERSSEAMIRSGLAWGCLEFKGAPATPDLALAPSSLLPLLGNGKVAPLGSETPLISHYGGMSAAALREVPFNGQEPEALGSSAVYGFTTFPKELRGPEATQRELDDLTTSYLFRLGRRIDVGTDVLLEGPIRARAELVDFVADRDGLKFADLPKAVQDRIMKGARDRPARGPDSNPPLRNAAPPVTNGAP